eukprot:25604_1
MVKLEIDPLSDKQVEIVQQTLDTLSDVDNRRQILEEILSECPELTEGFSMVVGIDRQSAFLMNMMSRGFNYICYQSFEAVFEIFARHPKYGIKLEHFTIGYKYVLACIEKNCSNIEGSLETWNRVCEILEYISDQAYNRPNEKKLNKMKKRVLRSMSSDDISSVCETWKRVLENEIGVADILANLLSKETKIIQKFHEFNIDVFKQSVIILKMIGKVLEQLSDIEMLIPFLRSLGAKHVDMGVTPRLLALMKPILITTLEKTLGFSFTDSIKTSWNKVLSFVIGIMVEVARTGLDNTTMMSGADSIADIDNLEISNEIISITQSSWRECSQVIDKAVGSFYRDLLSLKPEIRNLFSKSNMKEQATKLVRAIGSVIALLDNQETLIPILEELGRRHVYYNVQPKYFKYLKKAWFNMLRQALALRFTPKVEECWNKSWQYITTIMITSLADALLLYIPPEPEKIKFKVLINHIDRIKVSDLSFYADIWYAGYTGDNPSQSQAFSLNQSNEIERQEINNFYDSNNKPLELPPFGGIRVLNAMDILEMYRHKKERYVRKFTSDDTWFLRGNLRGTFAQMYDLKTFPFDQHKLELTFALDVDDSIALIDDESLFIRLMPFKKNSMGGTDWDIYQPQIAIKEQSAMSGGSSSGKKYTHCQVIIPISRKYNHHIYETILPLLLIELVAYGVYFSEEFPMVERLTVVVTLLLTLFAFKWTVAKSLPSLPYLTLMDHFFNSAYFMLFLHIIGLSIISFFESENQNKINIVNWVVCIAHIIIWILIHSYLFYLSNKYITLYPKKQTYDALGAVARAALKSPSKKVLSNDDIENQHNKKGSNKYKVHPDNREA